MDRKHEEANYLEMKLFGDMKPLTFDIHDILISALVSLIFLSPAFTPLSSFSDTPSCFNAVERQ